MDILKLSPELVLENRYRTRASRVLMFWLPVVAIFFIGNTSTDWYVGCINNCLPHLPGGIADRVAVKGVDSVTEEIMERAVVPARESVYFYSLILLVLPMVAPFRKHWIERMNKEILHRALKIYLVLTLLVLSVPVSSLAKGSLNPFGQSTGWFYRRIFTVALARFTHLDGYILFPMLLCVVMYIVICTVILFLEKRDLHLSTFQYVSLFSSGLIIHHFHVVGGRTEGVVFLLALLSLILPLSKYGRATLIVFMFSTHEAAALCMSMPLILFVFPKGERSASFTIVVMYFFLWLMNFQFDIRKAIEAQALIGNEFAFEGAIETPLRVVGGMFFSYKMLWCFIPVASYYFIKNREYVSLCKVLFAVGIPVSQIVIAYDTSRLIAFGYLGILGAVIYGYCYMPRRYFNLILCINLVIPSYDVGVWGMHAPQYGLYKIFHMLLT